MNKTLDNLLQKGMSLQKNHQLQEAKEIYLEILQLNPDQADALHLMGILHKDLEDYDVAIAYFNEALKLKPEMPQLHHNAGLAYQERGNIDTAIMHYQKALQLQPSYSNAYLRLANIYSLLEQNEEAFNHFQKALSLKPAYVDGWLSYGHFFVKLILIDKAIKCYETALKYEPDNIVSHFNLGKLYARLNSRERAEFYFLRTLTLDPSHANCFAELVSFYDKLCDWRNYDAHQQKLLQIYEQEKGTKKNSIGPGQILVYDWPAATMADIARKDADAIGNLYKSIRQKLNFSFRPRSKTRLKIGYFSSDFRDHAVGHLVQNLFATHDREQFEIFAFSHGIPGASDYRHHIEKTSEHFIDLFKKSYVEIAQAIYDSGIDILVDLNGHSEGHKMPVLAMRPAPIQCLYLGFPGTSGADFIDYFMADDFTITPENAPTFREKLVYLPPSRQINNNQEVISDKVLKRSDYQLPEEVFVFCCFNNNFKIDPSIFKIWMEILHKAEHSILWLYAANPIIENNLRSEAEKHCVDSKRLFFAKREEKAIHLARHALADLFLDTRYFGAQVTATDALWAGLPVLTCPGKNFVSRVTGSLVNAAGLPELIMPDLTTYRDTAIYFAHHPTELKKIRDKLKEHKKSCHLFNNARTVANLEKAYLKMWDIYQNGLPPQDIVVSA